MLIISVHGGTHMTVTTIIALVPNYIGPEGPKPKIQYHRALFYL